MGKRELVALFCLSFWCLRIVVWLFLTIPRVCLQFMIVVFPDHTHLLFFDAIDGLIRECFICCCHSFLSCPILLRQGKKSGIKLDQHNLAILTDKPTFSNS